MKWHHVLLWLSMKRKWFNTEAETFKLPVEVDKFNWYHILRKIESYADIKVERRVNEDVAFITDNGNYILDCKLPKRN